MALPRVRLVANDEMDRSKGAAVRGRGMDHLNRDECIKLMERHPICVGRIALAGPRPTILPVNYAIDHGRVVFRTDPGTKLHAALDESFVAFEVDWVEPTWQMGWSVVVRGQAHVVDDPTELQRLRRLPLAPWVAGEKEHFVSIDAQMISGRRLSD